MDIKQLLNKIEEIDSKNLNLYFVTRILKDGIKSNAKLLDKYFFKVYQIEITDEVRAYLYELSTKQFKKISENKDLEFHDYDVFSDDSEHLFTYTMKNKVMSFSDVVYDQLKGVPQKITDLNEILTSEQLWAYCVGFQADSSETLYTFRKISPGKVGVDDNDNKSLLSSIRTIFDTTANKLSLLKGETIYLDKQIDCIFHDETFYVLKKGLFEQIVGLQEEYKEQALKYISVIEKNNNFGDIKLLSDKVGNTPSMHKKIVRLKKIGNLDKLNPTTIKKLQKLGKSRKTEINIKDGKIVFENEKDIDNAIKLLCDYYKKGEFSDKVYGTFAGKEYLQ